VGSIGDDVFERAFFLIDCVLDVGLGTEPRVLTRVKVHVALLFDVAHAHVVDCADHCGLECGPVLQAKRDDEHTVCGVLGGVNTGGDALSPGVKVVVRGDSRAADCVIVTHPPGDVHTEQLAVVDSVVDVDRVFDKRQGQRDFLEVGHELAQRRVHRVLEVCDIFAFPQAHFKVEIGGVERGVCALGKSVLDCCLPGLCCCVVGSCVQAVGSEFDDRARDLVLLSHQALFDSTTVIALSSVDDSICGGVFHSVRFDPVAVLGFAVGTRGENLVDVVNSVVGLARGAEPGVCVGNDLHVCVDLELECLDEVCVFGALGCEITVGDTFVPGTGLAAG